jgi:hypothetical protein
MTNPLLVLNAAHRAPGKEGSLAQGPQGLPQASYTPPEYPRAIPLFSARSASD